MKILIYGINYKPELTGIGKYTGEMATWLADQGHEVTMITALPYYPEWSVHPSYKGRGWVSENVDGVKVIRCPLYVPKTVTSVKRIIHEFSFIASSFPIWLGLLFKRKADIVFTISPPFHLGFLPLIYSFFKGTPVITHIQDLQVDAARDLGMIKNNTLLNVMINAEKFLLQKSDYVSSISPGMRKKILTKGVSELRYIDFPNWVDASNIKPMGKELSLRKEWSIPQEDKVILYSGNLGEKQGLEIILEVAKSLADSINVHFIIVGSGGGKEKLQQRAISYGLNNVKFYPLQPYDKLSALLATADVHLILQKKSASDLVMPSKLTSILAAGGCFIVTADPGSTLFDVVTTHDLGIVCPAESEKDLEQAVHLALSSDLGKWKSNARAYAEKNLDKYNLLKQFEKNLEAIVRPS